jgi:hypothetical protein
VMLPAMCFSWCCAYCQCWGKSEDFHVGHSWYKSNGKNTVITLIITGCMKNTTLRKLELFPLAVEGR